MDECDKIGEAIVVDSLTLVLLASHGCLSVLDGFSRVHVNFRSVATLQQQFLWYGFSYLSDVLTWFQQSQNVILEPDGFVDETNDIAEMFSPDFVACCNIASTNKVSFLYCDSTAGRFQRIPGLEITPDVVFISIPAVCYKMFASDEDKLNDVLYSLLKDTTFINFDAETILYQVRKENYNVSSELIAPFMFCTTACDMKSFANVYLSAIGALTNECPEAAVALACIVLEDAFKIWKRGTYYRLLIETNPNAVAEYKVDAISEYVLSILKGMEEIFPVLSDELMTTFDILSNKSGYRTE